MMIQRLTKQVVRSQRDFECLGRDLSDGSDID